MLRNAATFQLRAQNAANLLQQGCDGDFKSLSNLTSVSIKQYSLLLHSERDKGLKTLVTYEADDDLTHNNVFHDDTEWQSKTEETKPKSEIKLESAEVKLESQERNSDRCKSAVRKVKKSDRYTKKRREERTSPKFRLINAKNPNVPLKEMYDKIRINSNELKTCMEVERSSEYYKKRPYKCEDCIVGFYKKKQFVDHYEKKHLKSIGNLVCDICNSRFPAKPNLLRHVRSHYFKFKCRRCPYECLNARNQMGHYHKAHERQVECLRCELQFVNQTEFFRHYREWHTKFICNECGYTRRMKYSLINHIRIHHTQHPQAPVQCNVCSKTLKNRHVLCQHLRLQHPKKEETAYCVECDRHFKNRHSYRAHILKKHSPGQSGARNSNKHPCPDCDKMFSKNIYMKNHHEYVHLKLYRNTCEPCGKKFMRPAQLIMHNRSVHEGIQAPKNKLCYICGRGFTNNKILANHIRVHTGERPFACQHCAARFTQRTALVTHTRNVHGKHKANNE